MSKTRDLCAKCGKESEDCKLCSKCRVAAYCCKECQAEDWQAHKKYCKRWVYSRFNKLSNFVESRYHADAEHSEVFKSALEAAKAKGEEVMIAMTPIAAEKFLQTLHDDFLPSCEAEERIWGLWGEPSSPGYSGLLTAYQKAYKYGDLSATKLMEALCAKPHASKALTDLLRNTKMVCTETDSLEMNKYVVDRYLDMVKDIQVDSEFDRWPIKQEWPAAGAAAAAAAGVTASCRKK